MRQLAGTRTSIGGRTANVAQFDALDSLTRSVNEGIPGENEQPKPLADASGYKLCIVGLTPVAGLIIVPRVSDASLPATE